MIQGERVQLHKGSLCLITLDGENYENDLCSVQGYRCDKRKWHVKLGEKGLLAPETSLRFCFSLLPPALTKLYFHHHVSFDAAQGSCGRGLVAGDNIKAGAPIFEEPPLLVCFKSAESPLEHHEQRWRAYKMLIGRAQTGPLSGPDGPWAKAAAAFTELGFVDDAPEHVRDAAEQIAAFDFSRLPGVFPSDEARATHLQHVTEVLLRFHCNQFSFPNGVPERDPYFDASAVYAFTSRINHSCAPSVRMVLKEAYCKAHCVPYDPTKDGGIKVAVAARDISKGERLTFSYLREILDDPAMGTAQRQALLRERLSFSCGCERCVDEAAEAAEAAEAVEQIEEVDEVDQVDLVDETEATPSSSCTSAMAATLQDGHVRVVRGDATKAAATAGTPYLVLSAASHPIAVPAVLLAIATMAVVVAAARRRA